MLTYEQIKANEELRVYITKADESMAALGFTEHSFAHVTRTAETAAYILETLGYDAHTIEMARIAGYMHDIGNIINRVNHSISGATMAFHILERMGMEPPDIATVVTAIGNHDEGTGVPVNAVSAALILADKTDVRRSRVRNLDSTTFDIHDRVNYSVENAKLTVSDDKKTILLELAIDTSISPVMDYFEIFLVRMIMCRKAADKLGLAFRLHINGQSVI